MPFLLWHLYWFGHSAIEIDGGERGLDWSSFLHLIFKHCSALKMTTIQNSKAARSLNRQARHQIMKPNTGIILAVLDTTKVSQQLWAILVVPVECKWLRRIHQTDGRVCLIFQRKFSPLFPR